MATDAEAAWTAPADAFSASIDVQKDGVVLASLPLDASLSSHTLSKSPALVFGRNSQHADVVLEHASISRRHAAVGFTSGTQVSVLDLGATHGTFLNGERLPPHVPRPLRDGDVLTFGASSRRYILRMPTVASHVESQQSDAVLMPPPPPKAPRAGMPPPPMMNGPIGRQYTRGDASDDVVGPSMPLPPPVGPMRGGLARQVTRGDASDDAPAEEEDDDMPGPSLPPAFKPVHVQSAGVDSSGFDEGRGADRRAREAAIEAIRASFSSAPEFKPRAAAAVDVASAAAAETIVAGEDAEDSRDDEREDAFAAFAAAAGMPTAFGGSSRQRRAQEYLSRRTASDSAADEDSAPPAAAGTKRARETDASSASDADVDLDEVAQALGLPVSHEVVLAGHSRAVSAVAMDPSGARVITGSLDYSLRMYDFGGMDASHRPFRDLVVHDGQPVTSVAYSPSGDRFIVGTSDARPRVYDRDAAPLRTFVRGDSYIMDMCNTKGHVAAISCVRWHPTQADTVFTTSADGSARFWNLTGRTIFDELLCGDVIKFKNAKATKVAITSAALSSDGGFFIVGCDDGSLQLVNVRGAGHRYVRPDNLVRDAHAAGEITSIALAGDGHRILTRSAADECVRVWDVRKFTSSVGGSASSAAPGGSAHPACVATVTGVSTFHSTATAEWSPDARTIAMGTDVKRGSAETGKLLLFEVAALEGAPAQTVRADDAVYKVAVCERASAAVSLWHPRIHQIVVGCGDGASRVLYRPGMSIKGALLSSARAPKRREAGDSAAVGRIINPDALPMYRDDVPGMGRKRAFGAKSGASNVPSRAPTSEPEFVSTGMRSFTQVFMAQHHAGVNLRTQDPAEVLRSYAAKVPDSAEAIAMRRAYSQSQPKPIYAERTVEEEEEHQRKELEELLRGNIAGR